MNKQKELKSKDPEGIVGLPGQTMVQQSAPEQPLVQQSASVSTAPDYVPPNVSIQTTEQSIQRDYGLLENVQRLERKVDQMLKILLAKKFGAR